MSLATHAIIGAATARVLAFNPIIAVLAAFVSHFILDAIPHWDYKLKSQIDLDHPENGVSMTFGRAFVDDLIKINFDFFLGLAVVVFIFFINNPSTGLIAILGAVAGTLPDFLQFVNGKIKNKPQLIIWFQQFHNFSHTKWRLAGRPIIGILSQAVFVVIVLTLVFAVS